MTPKITIVVPVYNVSKYLKRCLDSILKQTYTNFECICINDWSTDNSLDILNEYAKKDKRIIVYSQKNQWLSATRNVWINHATWEYITFIDSDDFVKEDYIESFIKGFSTWDFDAVIWWYIKYTWKNNTYVSIKDDWVSMFFYTPVAWRMFRTSVIKENKLEFPVWLIREDAYFSTKFYNITNKIKIIDYAWYYYYIENQASLSHTTMKKFESNFLDWCDVMNSIKPLNEFNNECKNYLIIRAAITNLLYAWRNEKYKSFINEYKKIYSRLDSNIKWWRKNKYISLFNNYDYFLYKTAVWWFVLISRLWLVKVFAKIWCK